MYLIRDSLYNLWYFLVDVFEQMCCIRMEEGGLGVR